MSGMRLTGFLLMICSLLMVFSFAEPCCAGTAAVLCFESFDGGGPEYDVSGFDEGVVSLSVDRKYFREDHDMLTGAGYSVIMTFTGLRQGETTAHISCYSPIAENWEMDYDITVDKNLNVTVKERPYVTELRMIRGGFRIHSVYEVEDDGMYFILHKENGIEDDYQALKPEVIPEITAIINKYDVLSWDGFDKYNRWVLDGEDFTFELVLSDGTKVYANGSNKFPKNYREVFSELEALFENPENYL